jgi:large subunit ribosomal protein L6
LIANAIKGQSEGYHIPIYLIGVGYRAALEVDQRALTSALASAGAKSITITNYQGEAGKLPTRRLTLRLGYSHPIFVPIPDDITVIVPAPTIIRLWSRDKQKVGQFAADIRALREPEVYKGKVRVVLLSLSGLLNCWSVGL